MTAMSYRPAPADLARLKASLPEWLPILLCLLAMYGPTFYDLFHGAWATEEQAHGPIILALSLWLMWRQWPAMLAATNDRGAAHAAGWPLMLLALALYVLGRSQQILAFELGSLIMVGAALLLIKRGARALSVLWFPFFFMLFMVPLPGAVVSTLTMPMKMAVSYVTEQLLFLAGYPISRNGVILQIGQYQLLWPMPARACKHC